jgi:hypothetical protein
MPRLVGAARPAPRRLLSLSLGLAVPLPSEPAEPVDYNPFIVIF